MSFPQVLDYRKLNLVYFLEVVRQLKAFELYRPVSIKSLLNTGHYKKRNLQMKIDYFL